MSLFSIIFIFYLPLPPAKHHLFSYSTQFTRKNFADGQILSNLFINIYFQEPFFAWKKLNTFCQDIQTIIVFYIPNEDRVNPRRFLRLLQSSSPLLALFFAPLSRICSLIYQDYWRCIYCRSVPCIPLSPIIKSLLLAGNSSLHQRRDQLLAAHKFYSCCGAKNRSGYFWARNNLVNNLQRLNY